jgi:hypothetical protein
MPEIASANPNTNRDGTNCFNCTLSYHKAALRRVNIWIVRVNIWIVLVILTAGHGSGEAE